MNGLDPRVLVPLWEAAADLHPQERALRLLAAARGDGAPRALLAALPLGARDGALLAAWGDWFGDEILALDACPSCAETVELSLSVSALLGRPAAPAPATLEKGELTVRFRPLDTDDLLAAGLAPNAASAERALRRRVVLEARRGAQPLEPDALPEEILAEIATLLEEIDPFAEILLPVDCPACGASWQALFEPAEHLWSRLGEEARRVLWDVHLLASAYGWTEAEVLALSPRRRQWYVDRVSA